jgi:hypothetical protein
LDQPLFELRPSLALPFHEQREDFDLATHLDARLVEQLVILEEADRFCPNPPSDAGFFKGFARGRFCRPQALDRPPLRNDPAFGAPRGDKEDFERGVWREPIGKRGVLDAKRRLDLPFAWLAANLTSPDSPASPATFWRLATQRIGGKLFAGPLGDLQGLHPTAASSKIKQTVRKVDAWLHRVERRTDCRDFFCSSRL